MAGGDENVLLYRFLQVVTVSIPIGVLVIALMIIAGRHRAEMTRIETANREVRQAVAQAQDWVRDGRLSDADQIEESLKAAEANSVATDKDSLGPASTAFQKTRGERQAAALMDSALEDIIRKRFDKAQTFLRQYLRHQYAKEPKRARTLLAEIALATSDDDAMRTLLALDDNTFGSYLKGNVPAMALSHPALVETRTETIKKNLAEASRKREEKRKKAVAEQKRIEAERLAEQKRIEAEKEAAERRERIAAFDKREAKKAARETAEYAKAAAPFEARRRPLVKPERRPRPNVKTKRSTTPTASFY